MIATILLLIFIFSFAGAAAIYRKMWMYFERNYNELRQKILPRSTVFNIPIEEYRAFSKSKEINGLLRSDPFLRKGRISIIILIWGGLACWLVFLILQRHH
ncbi:MAG: hypothetical protein WCI95_11995 [bacterium]